MNIASNYSREFQQRVFGTIQTNHLMEQGDAVVVGVSGGPDSVCLIHVLHALSETLGIKLHAVHVNHMLRAEEAQADEEYTATLCEGLAIPLFIVRTDIAEMAEKLGMSIEEAGREARYHEFEAYAQSVGAVRIAVAHNRSDQAETVMMHLIRGSGMAGLAGMDYRRGAVIRPLLNISRGDIEQYCKASGLSPRIDSSNLKSDFARNRVRLDLLPSIDKNFGTDVVESLYRLSIHATEDNSYLDQCAETAYQTCLDSRNDGPVIADTGVDKRVRFKLDGLIGLHPAILNRVLRMAVCVIEGSSTGMGSVHYNSLKSLIAGGKTGTRTELPHGLRAYVTYGRLEMYIENNSSGSREKAEQRKSSGFFTTLIIPGTTYIPELQASLEISLENAGHIDNYGRIGYNSLVQFFDYDCIKRGINIRNRRDGDIFKPFKSNGTKKLKEYFIDKKIPREHRDEIPLVCIENEAIWVIGYKISDKFKVTENTKSVLKMEYNRRTS